MKDPLLWRATDLLMKPLCSALGYDQSSLRRKESLLEKQNRLLREENRKIQEKNEAMLAAIRGDGPERQRDRDAREEGYSAGFAKGAASRMPEIEAAVKEHLEAQRAEFNIQRDAILAELEKRDGLACGICGAKEKLSVDHDVPLAAGGSNDVSNLKILCLDCNRRKLHRPHLRVI